MLWDPTFKPRLRPVEAFRAPDGEGMAVGIRDPGGLSDIVLSMSLPALQILSMMDGSITCEELCRKFLALAGQPLSIDTLQTMLDRLEQAHFLEGPSFEAFYQSLTDEYRNRRTREMPHSEALGIVDDSGDIFEEMLTDAEPTVLPERVRGLIVPHLDYSRGRPCYVNAYASLRGRPAPDRVIALGTNHFGRATSVVATASDFKTPLGTTHTDRAFLGRLEAECGNLRRCELDHAREHSIELQVAWLQHLLGADEFEIVAFLCHDPCGPTGTAPHDGQGVDLRRFTQTLGELVVDDDRDTLFVAGADLSHVGAAFGDNRALDEAFLAEVRKHDERVLAQLEANDPTSFLRCITERDNYTRVCSAGCIFTLATALSDATVTVLRYHQAVDESSQTCVTCAAVAFT